jgi:hypothetical protein
MVDVRNVYKILVGKPEGKRPFGKPRYRWENNIRIDVSEIDLGGVERLISAQNSDQ